MYARSRTVRPKPWTEYCTQLPSQRFLLLHRFNWYLAWVAWALGRWPLLDVLDHLGTFSVLIAVIFYFADAGARTKQRHYQAWQVINTAQGKGGSGGRIEALQELNADGVSLVGVNAGGAFLQGIVLSGAKLSRCDFHAADLRNSSLAHAAMGYCDLHDANLRESSLRSVSFTQADLSGIDMNGADLEGASLEGADLSNADLRNADVSGIQWSSSTGFGLANIWHVRNADAGFVKFAMQHGAVSLADDSQWQAMQTADSQAK